MKVRQLLIVEDNVADATLILEFVRATNSTVDATVIKDGEEAMSYLLQIGSHSSALRPDLVILDLNLPNKDGREVLSEVKNHPSLKSIPIMIFTTSQAEDDILSCYRNHANCYVTKPMELEKFAEIIKLVDRHWFRTVRLPMASLL